MLGVGLPGLRNLSVYYFETPLTRSSLSRWADHPAQHSGLHGPTLHLLAEPHQDDWAIPHSRVP